MRTHWFLQNGSFTLYASKWQTQLKRSYNNPIFCLCTVGPAPVSHVVPSPGRPVGTDGRAWLTPLFLCSTTTACVCQALCFLFSPVSAFVMLNFDVEQSYFLFMYGVFFNFFKKSTLPSAPSQALGKVFFKKNAEILCRVSKQGHSAKKLFKKIKKLCRVPG